MTFIMAAICRMEKVDLKKVRCLTKVAGTLVTVAGTMLMTLYKGPIMEMAWTKHVHPRGPDAPAAALDPSDKDWFVGSLFLIMSTLSWASLFILQAHTLKQYSAQLSLTTLICFVGTLQAIVVTLVMERRVSVWTIGFDMNLLSAAYAGIVTSSIAYYGQGLVMQKRGPVFASAFGPLGMIMVALMGCFILAEKIYLGGVLGAALIVLGLYSVLWGKYKEHKEEEEAAAMALPLASKDNGVVRVQVTLTQEVANGIEVESKNANGMSSTLHVHGQTCRAVSAAIQIVPVVEEEASKC